MKQSCFLILVLLSIQNLFSQSVGIGTANIDPSAKLQVESTNQGLLPPRLTTIQRNAIVNPAAGLIIFNTTTACLEYYNGSQWISTCQPSAPICYQNCNQIKQANAGATDGIYTIDVDCSGPLVPMQCYCDMTTDGGGWTLVLNYLHAANSQPSSNVMSNTMPLQGSTALGIDESNTQYWGHINNSLLNTLSFSSIRFLSKTSLHSRVIHFKTTHANTLSYFKTGVGSCSGIQTAYIALVGHTGQLPAVASNFYINQGNNAMLSFPFYTICGYHWGIAQTANLGVNSRWDADDCTHNQSCNMCTANTIASTHHQIWVK